MLLRGRSKDRERKMTPGPVFFSDEEFSDYLKNLRNSRMSRPGRQHSQPETDRDSPGFAVIATQQSSSSPANEPVLRCASSFSHRRAQSSISAYSSITSRTGRQLVRQPSPFRDPQITLLKPSEVVPSATYMERGQRWMEKEEAVSLREAMEEMDLKKQETEDGRIHAAAQNEASELVWHHENPDQSANLNKPYRYKDHLKKNSYQHARTLSVGRNAGQSIATGLARDMPPQSMSEESSLSGRLSSLQDRTSHDYGDNAQEHPGCDPDVDDAVCESTRFSGDSEPGGTRRKLYGSIRSHRPPSISKRKASVRRNISGEIAGTFTGDQIWEEPGHISTERGRPQGARDPPAPLRVRPRNPMNRVQFAQDIASRSSSTPPEPTKKMSNSEIHKNLPTQSRNPGYTANPIPRALDRSGNLAEGQPAAPMKDGLEIRSNEIRQATSMFLKDRSSKLPTPTMVSDKPGRPIVSFDSNWKPKEADMKPEMRRRSPFDRRPNHNKKQNLPFRPDTKIGPTSSPTIHSGSKPSVEVNSRSKPNLQNIALLDPSPSPPDRESTDIKPTLPTINLPVPTPSLPSINHSDIPTIRFPDSASSVPTIKFSDVSSVSVSILSAPKTSVVTPNPSPKRPLPIPKSTKPQAIAYDAAISRGHWSPAAGKRATATCHQCQLPIEGRVVKLSGASEHFHPECFICFSCGTGLESLEIHPEPVARRTERLERIKRRTQGKSLPEIEGQTMAEDGDERQRYYCHLDFHENFAPRCKHCKTPIIGEHMVALGEHWHYGHFFCAECGDPFEKGVTHIEKDGYAWCLNCQTKRTERQAPKCKNCKRPVIGEYVQALGGEWHEKCFRCATCNNGFDNGVFYPKEDGLKTVVLCIQCIERELKS